MKIHCLYDELLDVNKALPHPKNAQKHPKEQVIRLAKILEYQGWRYPIKISKRSGFITSGHCRLAAAIYNKWNTIPVNYQDYETDEQEVADLIADNAIADFASLDLSLVNKELEALGPIDIDLLGIESFTIEPLDKLDDDLLKEPEKKEKLVECPSCSLQFDPKKYAVKI